MGVLLAVPPLAVQDSHAAVQVLRDGIGYLLVLVRQDEELDGLLGTCQEHVQDSAADRDEYQTVHDGDYLFRERDEGAFGCVRRDEEGGKDDDQVHAEYHPSGRNAAVLVDYQCNDVSAARTAPRRHRETDAHTDKDTTHDDAHELAVVDGEGLAYLGGYPCLEEVETERSQYDGDDSLPSEALAKREEGYDEQEYVDCEIRVTDLDDSVCGVLYDRCDARHSSADEIVRDKEYRPSQDIQQQTQDEECIILDMVDQGLLFKRHLIQTCF